MARSSRTTILKRQRELRKAEKAAEKRAKRHGKTIEGSAEPRPTLILRDPLAPPRLRREDDEVRAASSEEPSNPGSPGPRPPSR
jgi:hypothetical protein